MDPGQNGVLGVDERQVGGLGAPLVRAHAEAVFRTGKSAGRPFRWRLTLPPDALGLEKPIAGDVVYPDTRNTADQEKYKGQLKERSCCQPGTRIRPRFEPLATRMNETNLLRLADAGDNEARGSSLDRRRHRPRSAAPTRRLPQSGRKPRLAHQHQPRRGGTAVWWTWSPRTFRPRYLPFLISEGAALVVNSSPMGDGGTFFVSSASIPLGDSGTNRFMGSPAGREPGPRTPHPPCPRSPRYPGYNRLVRIIQSGEKLEMAVELEVKFQDEDLMAYTQWWKSGRQSKDEVVMLGGHLDSWHAGTGATDDAIGVAVAMEAVRILQALKLQPRRTIRVGLWAGRSKACWAQKPVTEHFGYYTNQTETTVLRAPEDEEDDTPKKKSPSRSTPTRKLAKLPDYEKLLGYFNFDNGAGKIRGFTFRATTGSVPCSAAGSSHSGIWTRRR